MEDYMGKKSSGTSNSPQKGLPFFKRKGLSLFRSPKIDVSSIERELMALKIGFKQLDKKVAHLQRDIQKLSMHGKLWEDLRVGIFVDVQNMFYSARKQFAARVDYVKLLQFILKGRRLIKAIAYVIENPEIDQSSFFSLLGHHSFEVKKKSLIQRADGSQKGDWDMGIALDIISMADRLDVVALVSGDGDFVTLIELLKAEGPRVEVYGFPPNTALSLKEVADEFFPLGDEVLRR